MFASSVLIPALLWAVPADVTAGNDAAFLGVRLMPLPAALKAHLGLEAGVMVADVLSESPADNAGIQRHDVILRAGERKVDSPAALQEAIGKLKPGDTLVLAVRRGNESLTIEATLGSREKRMSPQPPQERRSRRGFLGIHLAPVPEELAVHLDLAAGQGRIVRNVVRNSPAARAELKRHDVLLTVDGNKLEGRRTLGSVLADRKMGESVKIELVRKGKTETVEVTLGERPPPADFGLDGDARGVLPSDRETESQAPRHRFGGRMFWRDPQGGEHVFEFPPIDFPDPDAVFRQWQSHLKTEWEEIPGTVHKRIENLLELYESKFGELERPGKPITRSQTAISRMLTEGYDVTVKLEDGQKTVTVVKDGKTVAENLPFDRLDSLPEEVQERVREVDEALPDVDANKEKIELRPGQIEGEGGASVNL